VSPEPSGFLRVAEDIGRVHLINLRNVSHALFTAPTQGQEAILRIFFVGGETHELTGPVAEQTYNTLFPVAPL
jgi:hypothetical protein